VANPVPMAGGDLCMFELHRRCMGEERWPRPEAWPVLLWLFGLALDGSGGSDGRRFGLPRNSIAAFVPGGAVGCGSADPPGRSNTTDSRTSQRLHWLAGFAIRQHYIDKTASMPSIPKRMDPDCHFVAHLENAWNEIHHVWGIV
jgi:hypothetical protein